MHKSLVIIFVFMFIDIHQIMCYNIIKQNEDRDSLKYMNDKQSHKSQDITEIRK